MKVYARELGNNITRSKLSLKSRQNGLKAGIPAKKKVESEDTVRPVESENSCEEITEKKKTDDVDIEPIVCAIDVDDSIGPTEDGKAVRTGKGLDFLDPNEAVYYGKESYNPEYIFWQVRYCDSLGTH